MMNWFKKKPKRPSDPMRNSDVNTSTNQYFIQDHSLTGTSKMFKKNSEQRYLEDSHSKDHKRDSDDEKLKGKNILDYLENVNEEKRRGSEGTQDSGDYEMEDKSDGRFNTLKKLPQETIISLSNIYKSFKISKSETIKVLKGININDNSEIESIKKGEFVMIRGPSGCGKTTLMNIIGTFDTPTEGTVVINGKEIKQKSDNFKSEIRLNYLGVVFQNYNLLNTLTVNENIRLPLEMAAKLKVKEINKKVEELLKAVGMLNRGNHLPAQLSGGQQQRA